MRTASDYRFLDDLMTAEDANFPPDSCGLRGERGLPRTAAVFESGSAWHSRPMTFERLRITGRDGGRYQLGTPMHVHDGSASLGTVDPVRVSRDGTEVHIERFLPSR